MAEGTVQRRGVPQAEAVAERFGQEALGAPTELASGILPIAKVARVDRPSMGATNVSALAANRSMIQLLNPAGTNTDLLLKRIWASSSATGIMQLSTHDAALASLVTTVASMVRQEGSQFAPVGQVRFAQGAVVGSQIGSLALTADTLEKFEFMTGDGDHFDGFVLQPGRGILVAPASDNVGMTATFEWLERQTA